MRGLAPLLSLLVTCHPAAAADPPAGPVPAPAAAPTYWGDVRPILRRHCTVCHKESKALDLEVSAGLALDSPAAIARGGVVPVAKSGKPDESLLVTLLTAKDLKRRMPLDAEPLDAAGIATLRRWVAAGMPEGKPPAETAPPAAAPPRAKRLPVTWATKASLPKPLPAGPLSLTLAVGPLPPVAAVAFSPDGQRLAVGSYGLVTVWDLKAARPERALTQLLGAVNDVKFSPDGKVLAVAGGQPSARGDLRLFDVASGERLASLGGHLDTVSAVAFSPDGQRLASASFDKTARLWDVKSGKVLHTFTGHADFVYAVAFSPQGRWYATASKDRTVRLVDVATGRGTLTLSGMDQEVLAVAVRPDGAQLVSSGLEPQMHWWDTATGERLKTVSGHNTGVQEIAFARSGSLAASAGQDKTVRLWDAATANSQRAIPTESVPFAVALDAEGRRVAAGCADGSVRVWEAASGRPLATLWSDATAYFALTPEGYLAASPGLVEAGAWAAAGKPLADAAPLRTLADGPNVARGLRGEKLPEAKFAAPAKSGPTGGL